MFLPRTLYPAASASLPKYRLPHVKTIVPISPALVSPRHLGLEKSRPVIGPSLLCTFVMRLGPLIRCSIVKSVVGSRPRLAVFRLNAGSVPLLRGDRSPSICRAAADRLSASVGPRFGGSGVSHVTGFPLMRGTIRALGALVLVIPGHHLPSERSLMLLLLMNRSRPAIATKEIPRP